MATATSAPTAPATPAPAVAAVRRPGRGAMVVAVLVVWVVLGTVLRGRGTLALAQSDSTALHQRLNDLRDWTDANRNSSPLFLYGFNEIRLVIDSLVTLLRDLLSQPSFGLPIPAVGWLGVVAVAGWLAWFLAGVRMGLLALAGFVLLGLLGLWTESMDTLALTVAAVTVSLLIGIPLGVWAGLSDRVTGVITPVLDFMQTMPTIVYLAPMTLFFLISPASATIATVIYATPPSVRITAHAIRSVPAVTIEAAESLGGTRWQTLRTVLLPMSRRTIVLGVNQTIMAAFSMVSIAALIDAPGLGQTVLKALESQDVGTAFNAGLALVVMAVVLDRVTTAAGDRAPGAQGRRSWSQRYRTAVLAAGAVVALVCVYLSRTYQDYATFPASVTVGTRTVSLDLGSWVITVADNVTTWAQDNLPVLTGTFKDAVSSWLLDPLQSLLADSPAPVTVAAILALAWLVGSRRAAVTTAVCLVVLIATGLWQDAMQTLAATLLATVAVMMLGVVVGVWMGRSRMADRLIRPVLDAGQVMPAFVYLVPFVALFAASRFTGITAAVVFAAPVAIKLVADGIRGVSPTAVEAATAAGSNAWQVITKVQLPMARSSLTLAANQGLIYVLSMVAVGGLVGAQALGFDVVAGFSQDTLFGKGLAAGLAIVTLGIMLDRITQAAARRTSRSSVGA